MKLNPTNISIIKRLLVGGRNSRPLKSIINRLAPADLASLLGGTLNKREVNVLLTSLPTQKSGQCLASVPPQQLSALLKDLDPPLLLDILQTSDEDNATEIIRALDEVSQKDFLDDLPHRRKRRIQQLLNYEEGSAGRMMHSLFFTVSHSHTAEECLDFIRQRAHEVSIYYLYCTDEENHLVGVISLRDLATAAPNTPLSKLTKKDVISVSPQSNSDEVAHIISHYDYVAIPVVDDDNHMVGLITIDDVLDIIQDQATADIFASAGLQEDDRVYSSSKKSIKNRLPWMVLNLVLASIASSVISLFEGTMSELIILASLNNIVAGMAGNTAIQTLTVVTRGLAIGDFNFISYSKGIIKETLVGTTMGLVTGVLAGLLVYFWKGSILIGAIIFISMLLNAIIATAIGAGIPLILKKLNFDPAAGSGVLVTMISDIFSFFSFLGLATIGLKYFV